MITDVVAGMPATYTECVLKLELIKFSEIIFIKDAAIKKQAAESLRPAGISGLFYCLIAFVKIFLRVFFKFLDA